MGAVYEIRRAAPASPRAAAEVGIYTLYRHFNADGALLYVGASCDPFHRTKDHRASRWFHDVRAITLEWFATTEALYEAERIAIRDESPVFNIQHRKTCCNPAPVKGWALRGFHYACLKWFQHIPHSDRGKAIEIAIRTAGLETKQ